MASLCRLPGSILEDIISSALDLGPAVARLQDRQAIDIVNGTFNTKLHAFSLLLTNRQLSSTTTAVVFAHALFRVHDTPGLRHLINTFRGDRLSSIRNIDLTLYSDNEYEYSGNESLNEFSECAVRETTDLMAQLPADLYRLSLQWPYRDLPGFSTECQMHPRLLHCLWRFRHLRELTVDAYDAWFHVELFAAVPSPFPWMAVVVESAASETKPRREPAPFTQPRQFPMFGSLSYLSLNGCVSGSVRPLDMAAALSETHLPALRSLHFDGLLCDQLESDMGYLITPACMAGIGRLSEFEWINYDFDQNLRGTKGDPHIPPTRAFLAALRERHGKTLHSLVIDYTGWDEFDDDLDENVGAVDIKDYDWDAFLDGLPLLRNAHVKCPNFGISVERGDLSRWGRR